MTNEEVIKSMSTEMLANYLFERGNCCEYCYGICANQDYCSGYQENTSVCIKGICKWLRQEQEHDVFNPDKQEI